MNKSIGVLGSGWLGTPLAETFAQEGYTVKGSTTTKEKFDLLSKKGASPYLILLEENRIEGNIEEFLDELEVIIINVPPGLRSNPTSSYPKKMKLLLDYIKKSKVLHVLFVSSTSVYGNLEGEITEDTPPAPSTNSGKQLLETEELFLKETNFSTSIVRFGGLISEDRHPIFRLSGKELTNGEELVNLIHRKDCIHMIKTIIENGYWNEVFNGVYPYHPTKSEYYTSEAKKRGIPPPNYKHLSENISKKKVIFRNFYVKNHDLTTSISS